MLSEMEYGQHFWKYPKDKAFLIQMQFYSNRVKTQKKYFGTEFAKIRQKIRKIS